MSSMRNAVQRRNHRERAQPAEREKWGLLEKHKDYSARAKDFNIKKTKLKALKQKVLEKNPDEFYFGMMSRKGPTATGKNRTGTVNGDRGNQVLSQDAVRLFKTQDLGYVRTMRNKTAKEVLVLEKQVIGIRGEGQKIVYVDNEDEQMDRSQQIEDEDDDDDDGTASPEDIKKRRAKKLQEKELDRLEARLEMARERLLSLAQAEEALELQRAKMAKSSTVGGVNKNGVKFKIKERKR